MRKFVRIPGLKPSDYKKKAEETFERVVLIEKDNVSAEVASNFFDGLPVVVIPEDFEINTKFKLDNINSLFIYHKSYEDFRTQQSLEVNSIAKAVLFNYFKTSIFLEGAALQFARSYSGFTVVKGYVIDNEPLPKTTRVYTPSHIISDGDITVGDNIYIKFDESESFEDVLVNKCIYNQRILNDFYMDLTTNETVYDCFECRMHVLKAKSDSNKEQNTCILLNINKEDLKSQNNNLINMVKHNIYEQIVF